MNALLTSTDLEALIWAGDTDQLNGLAGCACCCDEHTYEDCPARQWFGCRGQNTMTRNEEAAWARHYAERHGISQAEFYGYGGSS